MKRKDEIKAIFDSEVAKPRFSMSRTFSRLIDSDVAIGALQKYEAINNLLGRRVADHVFKGMVRATFLIELVQEPKIETTKYRVRWTDQLDPTDPRYASYEECLQILKQVMTDLEEEANDKTNRELLQLFQKVRNSVSYEIPLGYRERRTETHIHRSDNICWFFDSLPKRVVKLRSFLLDKKINPYAPILRDIYSKKIKIKTYLTDRSITGDHKTNREKRWETHPASVQFALRRTCMEIELVLISQLSRFKGFPSDLKREIEHLAGASATDEIFRCPMTLDPLSFAEFESEVKSPEHGKASFQIGHLNPLKAVNDDYSPGHTAQNVSWMSSDGNRIQGHLPLEETRALIRRIYKNYRQFGLA